MMSDWRGGTAVMTYVLRTYDLLVATNLPFLV